MAWPVYIALGIGTLGLAVIGAAITARVHMLRTESKEHGTEASFNRLLEGE